MQVVCIDDEHLSLDYLERQLQKVNHVEVTATFTNPLKGIRNILQEETDIVFLDIQMPQVLGVELAEQILTEKPKVIIIFVTAYEDFEVDAFHSGVMDYFVTSVILDRLLLT